MTRTPFDCHGPAAPLDTGLTKAELETILKEPLAEIPTTLFETRALQIQPFPETPGLFYLDFVYGGVAPYVYGGPDSGDPSEKP